MKREEEKGRRLPAKTPGPKLPYIRSRSTGLPTLHSPLLEHLPRCFYGRHGLGIHPASVVKLWTEQLVELLRSVDVHQEEAAPLAAEKPRFSDLGRLHDSAHLRPEPLVAHGPSVGQNDVFVNLEGDMEQHFFSTPPFSRFS